MASEINRLSSSQTFNSSELDHEMQDPVSNAAMLAASPVFNLMAQNQSHLTHVALYKTIETELNQWVRDPDVQGLKRAAKEKILEMIRENRRSLDLANLGLTSLPPCLRKIKQLIQCDFSNNALHAIPDWISELTQLTYLGLNNNSIGNLPDSMSQLTQLTQLNLASNNLEQIPDCISRLTQLTQLNLASNNLEQIPDCISRLTELREFDLSNNVLTSLPDTFGQLTQLVYLDLSRNRLNNLPDSMDALSNLTSVPFLRNPGQLLRQETMIPILPLSTIEYIPAQRLQIVERNNTSPFVQIPRESYRPNPISSSRAG